jgi:hypothetical protein
VDLAVEWIQVDAAIDRMIGQDFQRFLVLGKNRVNPHSKSRDGIALKFPNEVIRMVGMSTECRCNMGVSGGALGR